MPVPPVPVAAVVAGPGKVTPGGRPKVPVRYEIDLQIISNTRVEK